MQSFVVLVTTRIWQLAAINLVAIGLVLLGLGLFGLAPALTSSLWATWRLRDTSAGELVKGMWREYRREFLTANLTVLPLLLIAAGIGTLAFLMAGIPGAILFAVSTLLVVQALAALFVISIISGNFGDALANASTAMALAPCRILLVLALIPIAMLVAVWQPLVGIYFALSGWSVLANHIVIPGIESSFPGSEKQFFRTEVQS